MSKVKIKITNPGWFYGYIKLLTEDHDYTEDNPKYKTGALEEEATEFEENSDLMRTMIRILNAISFEYQIRSIERKTIEKKSIEVEKEKESENLINEELDDPSITDWVADNENSVFNKHSGDWIIFQKAVKKKSSDYFEFGFNGADKVFTRLYEEKSPKFYEETKNFMNRILKKYDMEEIK